MTGVLWPDGELERGVVGGKAASLARLIELGFDVPPFFVLTDQAFAAGGPPDVAQALTRIGPGPFAVRSSGVDEDGDQHSHAGQFDTELNISADAVPEAALRVRASGASERIAVYRQQHGLTGGAPAVVVQRMVPARLSGVAFSADPVSGRRDLCVVSATRGLGEALVSGEVDGETWVIGQDPVERPDTPAMSDGQALAVANLARQAEAAFGSPQDIEWAHDGDRLWLLQSRPITTPLRPAPHPDTAMVVLDNSNIIESYPGLVSPLTYSFAAYSYDRVYRAFVALLGLRQDQIAANASVFANLLTRVDGRVYYNLGNWYRALALLPGFSLNRGFMETMMGVAEPLPVELTDALQPPARNPWAERFRLARVGAGLIWQAIRLGRTKAGFMARLDAAMASGDRVDDANLTELAARYRGIEADLLDQWDAPLVNDFLCMIGFGASRKLLERWAGAPGLAFHNDIMIGQGGIVSAEPAVRIAAMADRLRETGNENDPDLQRQVADYLSRFGDRCAEELKLESIPLSVNPAPLWAAIRAAAARPAKDAPEKHAPDWAALLPGALRRILARALCNWAAARVRDRENLRFERTRIFGLARRVFLAMGRELHALGRLDEPRDVLFLTVAEVLGTIEGAALSADLKHLVALRKAESDAAAKRADPPARIILRGVAVSDAIQPAQPMAPKEGTLRQGTGCSAGRVTARAAVIRDPRTETLPAGDILVARNTDPGWISVFSNASAIVVERGSLLSHSAIVAREMGIPCVVGVADATDWVETGETLVVDGATGEVQKA